MDILLRELVKKIQARSGAHKQLELLEGLNDHAINALEALLGVKLPPNLVDALKYYGKTIEDPRYKGLIVNMPHFGNIGLATEKQIIAVYQLLKDSDYKQAKKHRLGGMAEKQLWNPFWIPIAAHGNHHIHKQLTEYTMIVLDRESPFFNQIIQWDKKFGVLRVLANSFEDYLLKFYNTFEDRSLTWDIDYGFSY